ncbi:TetR/AcrR family transcriptional regulator [Uniformispora flossi]|uniref:TetR/AcrR family transcriptional regulator n=1 Tax=Uniformispora flossi TaxID=3390723 RepID=UPI003C2B8302
MGVRKAAGHYVTGLSRRERILDAADTLFRECGTGAPSVHDVARAAGISRPGLLRYFASKEELLDGLLDRYEARAAAAAEDARPRDAPSPGGIVAGPTGDRAVTTTAGPAADPVGDRVATTTAWPAADAPLLSDAPSALVAQALRQAAVPGYVECLTSLAGEAVRADHPAHARMARRYRDLRADILRQLGPGLGPGCAAGVDSASVPGLGPGSAPNNDTDSAPRFGPDPDVAATCLLAGWEGLQLLSLYSPSDIDVAACLERRLRFLATPPSPPRPARRTSPTPEEAARRARVFRDLRAEDVRDLQERRGYATGHERRRQVIDTATTLFGTRGFHGISLRDIAKAVGISHSTLLHHFANKDELLRAVLTHHDYLMITVGSVPDNADEHARLSAVVETARRAADDTPGLMELFSTVSAEAVAPGHPAHAYFEKHFAMSRRFLARSFEHLAADGELSAERDPAEEGLWLLAVCEGLQRLRLYDAGIDAAGLLAADLARTLGEPLPTVG